MENKKSKKFRWAAIACALVLIGLTYYYFFSAFSAKDKVEYVYMIEFDGIYNRLVKAERLQKILADGSLLGQKEEIELKETNTGLEVKDTDIERLELSYQALTINAVPLYH